MKIKRFAALSLCGPLVAGCNLLRPVETPALPEDCVWVEFPYGFVCLDVQALIAAGTSSSRSPDREQLLRVKSEICP